MLFTNKESGMRKFDGRMCQRLFAIIQFLAEHSMAFRGSTDRIFQPRNGNFLGLVQLIAKLGPVMQEHLRRIQDGEIHDNYLGKNIQNELVQLMAANVKRVIVDRIKSAKYYSVILDCTPDLSHKEQMSLTIRYVSDGNEGVPVGIFEHFLEFVVVEGSTGKTSWMFCLNSSLIWVLTTIILEARAMTMDPT